MLLQNRPVTHVSIVDTASAKLKFIIDENGLTPAKKDGNFNSKLLYWADDLSLFYVCKFCKTLMYIDLMNIIISQIRWYEKQKEIILYEKTKIGLMFCNLSMIESDFNTHVFHSKNCQKCNPLT